MTFSAKLRRTENQNELSGWHPYGWVLGYDTLPPTSCLSIPSTTPGYGYTFGKPIVCDNGDILMVGTAGSTHLDTTNKVIVMRSSDGGVTWDAPVDVYKDVSPGTATRQLILFKEPSTGDIISLSAVCAVPFNTTVGYTKVFRHRSSDNGETWTTTEITGQIPSHGAGGRFMAHGSVVETSNGLMMPVYWFNRVGMLYSTDNANTWGDFHETTDVPTGSTEPDVVAITQDNIVLLCRDTNNNGKKAYKKSTDGGYTFGARSAYTDATSLPYPQQDQPLTMRLIGDDVYSVFPARYPQSKLITNRVNKDTVWADPSEIWNLSSPNRQEFYLSNTIDTEDYLNFGNAYIASVNPYIEQAFIGFFDQAPYPENTDGTVWPMIATFPENP